MSVSFLSPHFLPLSLKPTQPFHAAGHAALYTMHFQQGPVAFCGAKVALKEGSQK
jgi:hypothetical protein